MYTVDDYLEFVNSHPEYYPPIKGVEYILEKEKILHYNESADRQVGLRHTGQFNNFVVDLITISGSAPTAYERVIPSSSGAVTIVTKTNGKYLLLKQVRHIVGEIQLSFPRGFGESDINSSANARKEIREELGCECLNITKIGSLTPDSGLTAGRIEVFVTELSEPSARSGHEGIIEYMLASASEMDSMIISGEIDDGITIAAYYLEKLCSN